MQFATSPELEITVPTWRANDLAELDAVPQIMQPALCSHVWIARYCEESRRLRPDLRPSIVIRRAVAAYPYASDMAPERAAQLDASLSQVRLRAGH